jgi:hypothetical protein
LKKAAIERHQALMRDGTELLWKNKSQTEIESEVTRVFREVFCTPTSKEDDDENWDEQEPLIEYPAKLFRPFGVSLSFLTLQGPVCPSWWKDRLHLLQVC